MKNNTQRGETLMGFMTAVVIGAVVLTGAVQGLMTVTKATEDNKLMVEANDRARAIIDLMSYELRFAGAGIPFQQANFLMTDATLGTHALPILTSATTTSIAFRLNSQGRVATLAAPFDPSSSNTVTVVSNTGIRAGDTVYISNSVAGGTHGYRGTVTSAAGANVNVSAGGSFGVGATFAPGSLIEPVNTVTYTSTAAGVEREVGGTSINLATGGSFTIGYLDTMGTAMVLPLTGETIASNLASLSLTVNVPSPRTMSNNAIYTASLSTRIALRELNVYR